jgi:hypothetical protein
VTIDILPRLKAWDSRVRMSGCLGAHHSTAVGRGRLRSRRPTLSLAGATPAMPAASLVTFPDAGRCRDLGISPGDSVVANTVTAVADKRRAPPGDKRDGLTPDQGPGLAPKKVTSDPWSESETPPRHENGHSRGAAQTAAGCGVRSPVLQLPTSWSKIHR